MSSFITRRRVEFCDTDLAGMMHFSNFFRFMEFAEQEFLRARGLSVAWEEGTEKFGFPRVNATCDYRVPARFEQVLEIEVTIARLGAKSVTYEFTFRHAGTLIAEGRMTSVCCRVVLGGPLETVELPPVYRARLSS